jgi:hypothetical protein
METSKTSIRTLWVHPGGPKTGSSAIQNYLESNASALATKDVAYENKIGISQANEINSGNGARLFNAFANDDSSPTQIDEVVSSYLGNLNTGICSCEYLSDLTLSQWKRLASSCVRNGIRLNFIFCVRNVIPYFQSSYDQAIKRHGEWRELKDWIVELPWVHSITLKHLAQVVPSDRLRVIHYETCKSNLITEVLQAIDIDCSSPEFGAQSAVPTNRSLTVNERSVLRKINRVFGDIHSASISDHLLYNYPSAKTQLEPIPRQTKFDLIRRFSGEVERVNETFFLGKKIVSISETSEKNGEPSKLSTMSRPIAKIIS